MGRYSFFVNSNDRLFMKVKPFDGKYSVKCSDFFERVDAIQSTSMPVSWFYRPLNSEIEITDRCNQACPHCGMAANHMHYQEYGDDELSDFANELYSLGIPSYSITGGEPFLAFDRLSSLLAAARNKVDVCKITTNGFWGDSAGEYFRIMESNGLFDNKYFVPCLMVSIGEQSTPMATTCRLIKYAVEHYSKEELTLCVSSLSEYGGPSRVDEFVRVYGEAYGALPYGRVYLTEEYYRNSSSIRNTARSVGSRYVEDFMSGPVRCFEQTIGKYILPRLLVKATGEVCTCACFNAPRELKIGNYREASLYDILTAINSNEYVKIIAGSGLQGFRKFLLPEDYENVPCSNECEACAHLIHSYQRRLGL